LAKISFFLNRVLAGRTYIKEKHLLTKVVLDKTKESRAKIAPLGRAT
jgi:hypothetical protein